MRQLPAILTLLATLAAAGCTTGQVPARNLANDPAIGSDEQSFELRPPQGDLNTTNFRQGGGRNGMVMPDTGSTQMPLSRNSMPQ